MSRNSSKPHLVDNILVAAIERRIRETTENMAVCNTLIENLVPTVMVSGYVHHSCGSSSEKMAGPTFNIRPARVVALDVHRASYNSKLVENGATVHRLVLASRRKAQLAITDSSAYHRLLGLSSSVANWLPSFLVD